LAGTGGPALAPVGEGRLRKGAQCPTKKTSLPISKPALPKYGRRPRHEWQTSNLAIEQTHQSLGRLLLLKANVVRAAVSRCPRTTIAIPMKCYSCSRCAPKVPQALSSAMCTKRRMGRWYVTFGGGEWPERTVLELMARGDIRPIFNDPSLGLYFVSRTMVRAAHSFRVIP
jgi:hypothetical protein